MKSGDVAGLALLNRPYAWIGLERGDGGYSIVQFDQQTGKTARTPVEAKRVWLKADCDFLTEKARFSYSTDGVKYTSLGDEFTMVFQLKTFQGVRYALFNYNTAGQQGGTADFDSFDVIEPHPRGLIKPIPLGRTGKLTLYGSKDGLRGTGQGLGAGSAAAIRVRDMGMGRVALGIGKDFVSVSEEGAVHLAAGTPGKAQSFQWIETPTGEVVLMSLVNHRFLRVDPASGVARADSPGPQSDGKDGVRFQWTSR
jgi:xylan 1,4-beta-xylosidase